MKVFKFFSKMFFITILVFAGQTYAGSSDLQNVISWQFKTRGRIQATPLISNGILYIGSFDSSFYAIDAKTGAEKWHYKTQNQIYSTPVKYNNILCFESGNVLYGVNTQGQLEWKFTMFDGEFLNQHDEWDYYHSSPLLVDSIVYIGSENGLVFGVNAANGEKVFQCQSPSAKYTIETTPAVYDGKIYFGDWDGVFFAYDLTTAALVWSYDTKIDATYTQWVNAIVTDPVILDSNVIFGGRSCFLFSLNAKTGAKVWRTPDPGGAMWTLGGPTYSDGFFYMGSSYQHTARAYNAVTGKVVWQCNTVHRINGKPLVEGNYVIVGTEHDTDVKIGSLLLIDKTSGKLIAGLQLQAQIYSTPVLNDGLVYFGGTDGNVYAVNYTAFVNNKLPGLSMPGAYNIRLGERSSSAPFDTTVYVYNKGLGADSVSITSSMKDVSITPSKFYLAASDSQKITLTVNPVSLSAKSYSCTITISSKYSIPAVTITKALNFTIIPETDVKDEVKKIKSFNLKQNYPNPFNPATTIEYQLPEYSYVELKVFNIIGREIAALVDEYQDPGEYRVNFNTAGFNGLSSGIYFYKIKAGNYSKINKMVLMK